jgi:hypothetical protein
VLARTRRISGARRSAPRRHSTWAVKFVQNASVPTATGSSTDLLAGLEVGGVGIVGGTVVRTHVALAVSSVQADTGPACVWGLVKWDKTTAAPNSPQADTDFYVDWGMYRFLDPGLATSSQPEPAVTPTAIVWGKEYDCKARRRMEEMNDSWFFQFRNLGSGTQTVTYLIRTLVLLP